MFMIITAIKQRNPQVTLTQTQHLPMTSKTD